MTESQFINQNKEVWQSLEKLLQSRTKDPTKLSSHFTKVSGDLAFAQTYFPRRSVTSYLNDLVTRLYDSMKTKKIPARYQNQRDTRNCPKIEGLMVLTTGFNKMVG